MSLELFFYSRSCVFNDRMKLFHHVCTYVRVCASVISGLSILFKIYANPLNTLHLYTRQFALIFVMWDYLSVYLYAGDMARREASDLGI